MTLQELTESWTVGWNYLWQQAQSLYAEQIRSNPKAYETQVANFVQELRLSRQHLDRMKQNLAPNGNRPEDVARFNRLSRQHYELSTRFYSDTQPASQTSLGFVPVLIVLGLAVGLSATAWAVSAWQYATQLREQTALASRELDARVAASREGRTLQSSTLPSPPAPPNSGLISGAGKWVVGGLVVLAGAVLLPPLMSRK